jgi:DNA-directed RNA polymerase subunit K/omega
MSDSDNSDSDKYNSDSNSDSDNEDFAGGAKKVTSDIPIIDDLGDDEEAVVEEEVEDDDDEDGVNRKGFGFDEDVMSDDGLKQNVEEDDDDDDDDNDEPSRKKSNKQTVNLGNQSVNKSFSLNYDEDEDDDDDDENEHYLQKFNSDINKTYITDFHPECIIHNFDEVSAMSHVVRDKNGIIIDDLHKTIPFLTKYERARILGQRAKQIECGSKPFVNVPDNIIDSYIIAEIELKRKKIPFIIRRPIPGGSCEYWNLKDLEMVHF